MDEGKNVKEEGKPFKFIDKDEMTEMLIFREVKRKKFPRRLKGKEVIVEIQSLYDQTSQKTVVVERVEGRIEKIDKYGIYLSNVRWMMFANDRLIKEYSPISSNVILYHSIIRCIFVKS